MYPEELKRFISDRNNCLSKEDILFVIDKNLHTQLIRITYNSWSNSYEMFDRYGNYYHFDVRSE